MEAQPASDSCHQCTSNNWEYPAKRSYDTSNTVENNWISEGCYKQRGYFECKCSTDTVSHYTDTRLQIKEQKMNKWLSKTV
jgi:hypothetical protein